MEADFRELQDLQSFAPLEFVFFCTAPISKFEQNFMKLFQIFVQNSAKIALHSVLVGLYAHYGLHCMDDMDCMDLMDLMDCMEFMEFMDAGTAHNLRTF